MHPQKLARPKNRCCYPHAGHHKNQQQDRDHQGGVMTIACVLAFDAASALAVHVAYGHQFEAAAQRGGFAGR